MRAISSEVAERDALIEHYHDFVEGLVSRLIRVMGLPQRHREDFVAAGFLGLVEAAGRFDASRGSDFKSFAYLRIRGAVIDHIRASCDLSGYAYQMLKALEGVQEMRERSLEDRRAQREQRGSAGAEAITLLSKSAIALALSSASAEFNQLAKDGASDPENELHKKQLSKKIRSAVATLPEKERTIVEHYYFRDLTLHQVAERYSGLSKSWVSRLHDRALEILRDKLVQQGVCSAS
jgi:RNA polymerase sigma factor for flagellar operon FliA